MNKPVSHAPVQQVSFTGFEGYAIVADQWPGEGGYPILLAPGGGQTRHAWGGTGARLARNEIRARLGRRVECRLNGAYLGRGDQHIDNTTFIGHTAPDSTSRDVSSDHTGAGGEAVDSSARAEASRVVSEAVASPGGD